jgi:hypothetical protein
LTALRPVAGNGIRELEIEQSAGGKRLLSRIETGDK